MTPGEIPGVIQLKDLRRFVAGYFKLESDARHNAPPRHP